LRDGICDDGGPGAEYSICRVGTDEPDCGRYSRTTFTTLTSTSGCASHNLRDGICDDGGPGAEYSICRVGTDEPDCGRYSRTIARCTHTGDGDCDDGGPGSEYSFCALGTDEPDCAAKRQTCLFRNDGDCDDGGPGAEHSFCSFGTDEPDCGRVPRSMVTRSSYSYYRRSYMRTAAKQALSLPITSTLAMAAVVVALLGLAKRMSKMPPNLV